MMTPLLRGKAAIIAISLAALFECSPVGANEPPPGVGDLMIRVAVGHRQFLPGIQGHQVARITIASGQTAEIMLRVHPSKAGTPIDVAAVDGGQTNVPEAGLQIAQDGRAQFAFQPGSGSGTYRLLVQLGTDTYELRFHVSNQPAP